MILKSHYILASHTYLHACSVSASSNMHKSYRLFLGKYPQRLCLPVRAGLGQRLVNLAAYVCPNICMYMDVCSLRVSRLIGIWLTEWELMVMSPRWDEEQIGVWAPLSWLINLLFNSFTVRTNMATLPGKHKGHLPQTDPPDIRPKIKRGGVLLRLLCMLWSDWMFVV